MRGPAGGASPFVYSTGETVQIGDVVMTVLGERGTVCDIMAPGTMNPEEWLGMHDDEVAGGGVMIRLGTSGFLLESPQAPSWNETILISRGT